MVESVGSAPTSTCLQSRCITCLPRPQKNGRPPRCCPEPTEFWRLGCASWRAACENRCDPSARHDGGRLQGSKLKGPEAIAPPAHAISIKNKHLLVIYSIPARGFTAAVSVFRGTPPPKPLICKFAANNFGARNRSAWAHHTGGTLRHSCTSFRLALSDIIKTSRCYCSQTGHLSLPPFTISFRETKNPACVYVSRVREKNSSSFFRTCLHQVYPNYLRAVAQWWGGIASG
jgi:hypothetical protein